jgi:hypothetical protein
MSGGFVDLSADSDDEHGLLADDRDDDVVFAEDKTPKQFPRGQGRQGLAQILQSEQEAQAIRRRRK